MMITRRVFFKQLATIGAGIALLPLPQWVVKSSPYRRLIVSIDELNGSLQELAEALGRAGITAAKAGEAYRQVLLDMQPNEAANDRGITFTD